jgi:hypothetical protein
MRVLSGLFYRSFSLVIILSLPSAVLANDLFGANDIFSL